jgi:hypothetical protein
MTTKTLIASVVLVLLTLGQLAHATGHSAATPLRTSSFESRHHARAIHASAPSARDVSGVIPRAIRGGNPLQMFNPFAPANYGAAEENASFDPDVPGKANGIKLFSISF